MIKQSKIICVAAIATITFFVQAQTVKVTKYKGGRSCAVSLTFDDGLQEHYTLVVPHLNRYGLKGTFGINGVCIGDLDNHYAPRLTWQQCKEVASQGHEIDNHSWSHPNLTELDASTLQQEIDKNDSVIEQAIGKRPVSFLYPYNAFNPTVKGACEQGKVGSRINQWALGQVNSKQTAATMTDWIQKQKENGTWGVTMTHGIYTAWDAWKEPWLLWDFFRDLAYQNDSIWTSTFAQVQAYVKEYDNIQLKTKKRKGQLIVTPVMTLDKNLFSEPLTLEIGNLITSKPIEVIQQGHRLKVMKKENKCYVDIDPYGGDITIAYMNEDPLKDKVINVIGDSYVQNHSRPFEETWHYKVAAKHGMTYHNYGRNGGCVAFDRTNRGFGKPLYVRYKDMADDADYVLVIAGHNDAYLVDMNTDSLAVFDKHLVDFCQGLRTKYPKAKIGWVTPWNVHDTVFPLIISRIEAVCPLYGIKVLNSGLTSGINPNDAGFRKKYFQEEDDNAHLSSAGHDLLVEWGEQFLLSL